MNGRQKCELINMIRKKVADNNNIDFIIKECTFEGLCTGRCEKSDSELEYLESELQKRQDEGKKLNFKDVLKLDVEIQNRDDYIKRQEKMEKLMKNPELENLPSRYLDMLL